MAMETVPAHLITQFSDMMHVRAQQMQARFRPYVDIKRMTGDIFAYDGLGTVEARELTGRFNKTVFDDIEHNRRKIGKRRFVVTLPIDTNDLEGMLTDPKGQYARASVMAMERAFDRVCYDSLFADVQTGRDFSTTVTAVADGVLTVNATAGLTLAKMLELGHNWIDNEVGNDLPVDKSVGISGDEHSTLLQIVEFTNLFYTRGYALEDGVITRAAGMKLIPFGASAKKPVLKVTAGTRKCFGLAKDGLCVGMAREWRITIKDRPDYDDTTQVQITGVLGSVRTEGVLVQELDTTDI